MGIKEVTANCGFQQIATLTTAQALTLPADTVGGYKARVAVIHPDTQNIRWRDDGVAPTATVGMRLLVGSELYYDGELTKLQMIEETAGAKANVSYYA